MKNMEEVATYHDRWTGKLGRRANSPTITFPKHASFGRAWRNIIDLHFKRVMLLHFQGPAASPAILNFQCER
jgi:hypothetical protein